MNYADNERRKQEIQARHAAGLFKINGFVCSLGVFKCPKDSAENAKNGLQYFMSILNVRIEVNAQNDDTY